MSQHSQEKDIIFPEMPKQSEYHYHRTGKLWNTSLLFYQLIFHLNRNLWRIENQEQNISLKDFLSNIKTKAELTEYSAERALEHSTSTNNRLKKFIVTFALKTREIKMFQEHLSVIVKRKPTHCFCFMRLPLIKMPKLWLIHLILMCCF